MENKSLLYPCASAARRVISLDGMWRFEFDPESNGMDAGWGVGLPKPISMPVPASFCDFFTDKESREYCGDFWYETDFFVPGEWSGKDIAIRFGSGHYPGLHTELLMRDWLFPVCSPEFAHAHRLGERERHCLAEAGVAAGNDRDLTGEVEVLQNHAVLLVNGFSCVGARGAVCCAYGMSLQASFKAERGEFFLQGWKA